jgi:hypothetical protein
MKYFKILLLLLLSITKSEAVPGSILLAADREIKEQALREHPLYQEGIGLALQAAHHRNGLEEQARAKGIHSVKSHGVNHTAEKEKLQKEADRVKEEILKPLREVFEAPSTPRGTEKAKAFFSGMGESVKDTLELPLVLGKFGITVAQSVIEWEDKLGLKSAYEGVKDLFSEVKKDWEDDAAYQARQKAALEYKAKAQAYEKAFNAEHYHADQAKTAGYISAEALQFVFGEAIFKAGAQGVKAARATKNAAKGLQELIIKEGKLIGKQLGSDPAIRTITKAEVDDIISYLIKQGAKEVKNPRYNKGKGKWYALPDGKGFGVRSECSPGSIKLGTTHTIDVENLKWEFEGIILEKFKY